MKCTSSFELLLLTLATCVIAAPSKAHLEHQAPNGLQQSLNGDQQAFSLSSNSIQWQDRLKHSVPGLPLEPYDYIYGPEKESSGQNVAERHASVYATFVVLRFNVSNFEEANKLAEATNELRDVTIWEISPLHVDVSISEDDVPHLLSLLPSSLRNTHSYLLNVTSLHDAIAASFQPSSSLIHPTETSAFFRAYRPLTVLYPWLSLLATLFPDNAQFISVGHSAEGRPIQGLRIFSPSSGRQMNSPRKTLLVTAGAHAREWVSTSSAAYVAYSLLTAYGQDSDVTALLSSLDVLIVPTQNPDGYAYSWEHDRLWRKTRQHSPNSFCSGIDLDRNWGFAWSSGAGISSSNPCSENYIGQGPFEAVEAASFSRWLRNQTESGVMEVAGMLDLHSYSQQVLLPYAYSCVAEPSNTEDLEEVGQGIARAIKRTYGKWYEVLRACEGDVPVSSRGANGSAGSLAAAGGSPLDWFYKEMNVRYAYQIKLRDTGNYGFLLPPEYIVPAGREVFNAVLFFGRALLGEDDVAKGPSQSVNEPIAGFGEDL